MGKKGTLGSGSCGKKLKWMLDETGTLTISGTGTMYNYSSENTPPWFKKWSSIKEVVIEEGATSVGKYAFCSMGNLMSVSLPSTLKSVGAHAFESCSILSDVVIPEGVTTIGAYAFRECESGLKAITIPKSVTSIGTSAFSDCFVLEEVDIQCNPTTIGDYVFSSCCELRTVTLSNDLTKLGKAMFYSCGIGSITFPENLKSIPESAFADNYLNTIVFPKNLISIGKSAFSNNSSLYSVSIPKGVTKIDTFAFSGCGSLSRVEMPGTVTSIGNNAFKYCNKLNTVIFCGTEAEWAKIEKQLKNACPSQVQIQNHDLVNGTCLVCGYGVPLSASGTCGENLAWNIDSNLELTISGSGAMDQWETTAEVPWNAYARVIRKVTIENGVTSIGQFAFSGLELLSEISIPDTVKTISKEAFFNCKNLRRIVLPEGLTAIEESLFSNCKSLWEIILPDSVTHIGIKAFYGCSGLRDIKIPEGITQIDGQTFYGCRGLQTVKLPDSLTTIGSHVFSGCSSLKEIAIPAGVTVIGIGAFSDCSSLQTVIMPERLTAIGEAAFRNCNNLTYIEIPEGVTEIGFASFEKCINLKTIKLPESLTSIGWRAFEACSSLTSVPIPESVITIGAEAFQYCVGLKYVDLPDGLKEIGNTAFRYCSALKEVNIPDSVTSIGAGAFGSSIETCRADIYFAGTETKWNSYQFKALPNTPVHYNTVNAEDHWGDNYTAPTCNKDGSVKGTCSCGYERNETIPATGHLYITTVVQPTCTKKGHTSETCTYCGEVGEESDIDALGHTGGTATYTKRTVCDRCNVEYGRVSMRNHTGKKELRNKKEYSCTEDGYSGDLYCLDCEQIAEPGAVIPAAHTFVDEVIAPTYTKKGYTIHTCTKCPYTCEDTYTDALGLPTPAVTAVTDPVSGRPVLTWPDDGEADGYKIYRSTSKSGTYKSYADAEARDAFTDAGAAVSKTYYYKVKAIFVADEKLNSENSKPVSVASACEQPEITVEVNVSTGQPVLTWDKINGASKYTVYRTAQADGEYTALKTVTGTSYADTKATVGTTYSYKLKAVASNSTYNSAESNPKSCLTLCAQPVLTVKIDAATGKPDLSWNKITGAKDYMLLRADSDEGSYAPLVTLSEELCYQDTSAVVGSSYWYKIIAVGKEPRFNSIAAEGVMVQAVCARPVITVQTEPASGKPVIDWEVVDSAAYYEVRRGTKSNGSYTLLDTVTDAVFTDTAATVGKTYYYKVRALDAGGTAGAYCSAKSVICDCEAPEILSVTNSSSGYPVVKWGKVTGAKKYELWYATEENGTYQKLTTTSSTSYTYSKAKMDTAYYFKVRACGSSTSSTGAFSNVVLGLRKLAKPSVTLTTSQTGKKITVKWKKISSAVGYELQCSINGGEFRTLEVLTGLSYVHENLAPGNKYTYRLRAVSSREETGSDYSAEKSATIKVGKPVLTLTLAENGKPQLTWDAVEGAVNYQIYYATSKSGKYKQVETTEQLSFICEDAKAGKTCYFKVRAVDVNGTPGDYSSVKSIKSK